MSQTHMADHGPSHQGSSGPLTPPTPVLAFLAQAATTHGRSPALSHGGKTVSYERLVATLSALSAALSRIVPPLPPGAPIALLLPGGPALVTYTFAAFRTGFAPFSMAAGGIPSAAACRGARLLVTTDFKPNLGQAVSLVQAGFIGRVIIVPHASQIAAGSALRLRLFSANRLGPVPPALTSAFLRESDLIAASGPAAAVPAPGVPLEALAANVAQLVAALPPLARGTERILAAIPLTAPLAFSAVTGLAAAHAAELVIPDSLIPGVLARAVNRCRPTVIVAAPALLAEAYADTAFRHLSLQSLKLTLALGPRAPQPIITLIAGAAKAPLVQAYGLEEPGVILALAEPAQPPNAPAPGPAAMLSYHPLAGTRFAVRDLAGPARDIPRGERGALVVSGPQFPPQALTEGGFMRTGNVGLIDPAGRIVVIDRAADLIVASGYMIYPSRIEEALAEHPGVTTVAVIGVSDGRRGNAPKAFVVLKRGMAVTERDLRSHLSSRISKIEMPADIDFCARLPRTPFGTVDKTALRQEEAARKA